MAHFVALFNRNIRQALVGRYRSARELKAFNKHSKPIVYFHAASLGEFEHIRPLIFYLGKTYQIVVTFFSPSGFNHAKKQFEDERHFYLPFDFLGLWMNILAQLQPKFIIISKHDVWANQILAANRLRIPIFLVNASLSAKSSRINMFYRFFFGSVYAGFSKIFAISDEDKQRLKEQFNLKNVQVVGDTKFDQVLIRKEQADLKELLPGNWSGKSLIMALGSIWPEDYVVLKEPLQKLMQEFGMLKILFVPHQPHEHFVSRIENDFARWGSKRFTNKKTLNYERILVVNVVGVLADLYKYADMAYIGGSFKQGIHNVMEAAAYGIPVIYGPVYENSYEATRLIKERAAFVVRSEEDSYALFRRMITDENFRKTSGQNVRHFVQQHTGATKLILQALKINNDSNSE